MEKLQLKPGGGDLEEGTHKEFRHMNKCAIGTFTRSIQ